MTVISNNSLAILLFIIITHNRESKNSSGSLLEKYNKHQEWYPDISKRTLERMLHILKKMAGDEKKILLIQYYDKFKKETIYEKSDKILTYEEFCTKLDIVTIPYEMFLKALDPKILKAYKKRERKFNLLITKLEIMETQSARKFDKFMDKIKNNIKEHEKNMQIQVTYDSTLD